MSRARNMAMCGMSAALAVVILILGGFLGIGTYAAPVLAGLFLLPAGNAFGRKYQVLLWLAVSLLSFMVVPDLEESMIFFALFGWYPALRPVLQRLPAALRIVVKLLLFNVVIIAVEALLIFVLVPEQEAMGLWILLLAAGNAVFLLYDYAIPKIEHKYGRRLKHFIKK